MQLISIFIQKKQILRRMNFQTGMLIFKMISWTLNLKQIALRKNLNCFNVKKFEKDVIFWILQIYFSKKTFQGYKLF